MENWIIRIVDTGYKIGRDVYIFRKVLGGTEFLKSDGGIENVPYGAVGPDKPFIFLEPEQLQALADELDKVGYKPQKGFIEGKLDATQNHLKDLRTLLKLDKRTP